MRSIILTSSALILFLALLRRLLRGRISPTVQYALWLLVAARLLIPGSLFTAPVSLMGATEELRGTIAQAGETGLSGPPPAAGAFPAVVPATKAEDPGGGAAVTYAPSSAAPPAETVNWAEVIWKGGAVLVGAALAVSNLTFYVNLRKRRRLFALRPCRVYVAEGLSSPCLFGLIRPAIYLNEEALAPERLEHILAHEEAHRRHGDHLWAALRGVCLALHWYNPLVWWAAVLSRRDCELSCDEACIRRLGEAHRIGYGQTLLAMIVPRTSPAELLRAATTMTAGKRTMTERISLIARQPKPLKITLLALILVMCLAVMVTFGGSAEEPDDPSGDPPSHSAAGEQDIPDGAGDMATAFTADSAVALYRQAREIWDWFELGTLPTTGAALQSEEGTLFQVAGYDSLEQLRGHLEQYFAPSLAERLLTGFLTFRESGGKLYVLPAGRGSSIYAGKERVQAFLLSGAEAARQGYDCHIYATTEVLDLYDPEAVLYEKRHDWFLSWNGQNYVFTSFGPWDDVDPQKYYNALTIVDHCERGTPITDWLPTLAYLDWNALRATEGQWPEGVDLGMYILVSLSEYITSENPTITAAQMQHILSATEGLDGAYSEQYQFIVYELYQKAPAAFAHAVLEGLSGSYQTQVIDFFRYEEQYHRETPDSTPMTREEAYAMLREALSSSLSASPEEMAFDRPGQTAQFLPVSAYGVYAATYTSSDPGVAAVDDLGLVTAVSPGTATITLHYEGAGGPKDFTCAVTCDWAEADLEYEAQRQAFTGLVDEHGAFGLIHFLEGRENWNMEGLQAVLDLGAREALVGDVLEGYLDQVVISDSFTFPADPQSGQTLRVPVTKLYRTSVNGRGISASSRESICEIGLYEEGGQMPEWMLYNLAQASKMEAMTRSELERCASFGEGLEVPVSEEAFDVNTYIRDTVIARLEAAGLSDAWRADIIECWSYRVPSHEPPGTVQTIAYSVTFSFLSGDRDNITISGEIVVTTVE